MSLVLSGCKRDPVVESEKDYTRAQELLKEGKVEAAIIELRKAIQTKPDLAKAHRDLGKIYLERADITQAFQEYSLAIRFNPQDRDSYEVLGEILIHAREFSKAKDIATQILSNWPDDRYGKTLLAESTMGIGEWDRARRMIEQNAAEAPHDARAQFDLAALYVHDKKWPEAEKQLRLSWSLNKKVITTPLALAQLLVTQGNQKGAEDVLNQASADQPDRIELLYALAALYIQQRRPADAEAAFRKIQTVDADNEHSQVVLGEYYVGTKNLKAAEEEFRRVTAAHPQNTLAWHRLADLEVALNRPDEARKIVNDLLKKGSKDWEALTLLGRLDLEDGKPAQAEQELTQAKAIKPESPAVHFQLARVYLAQGKVEQARSSLADCLRRSPTYAPALILQASLEMRAGQTDLAVQDLSNALKQTPTAIEPNLMISQAYVQRGDFNLAEQTLQRMMEQSNTPASLAMIFQTLAVARFGQGRYADAAAFATKSLNSGLLSRDALRVLGLSYLAQKRPDQAIQSVKAFADKSEKWAMGQDALGEIALRANRLDVAEAAYLKELQIDPNSSSALFGLGDTYDRGQQFAKAEEYFRKFAAAQPKNSLVHLRLGVIAERNHDIQRAISEYQQAINLDASNGIAKNNLAWVYAQNNGDLNVALRLAQEARALLPDDPSVADTLGWVFVKKGMGPNALPYLKDALKKSPGNAVYHYHLGMAYALAGKKADARSELNAALRAGGSSFPNASDARKALTELGSSD